MAFPGNVSPTVWNEVMTTTLFERGKALADNVSKNNAILYKLSQKGNKKVFRGGVAITEPLEYAENGSANWYTGYELLDLTITDIFSMAQYDIKQLAATVQMSGLEMIQNAGPAQVIDLMEARVKNAEKTLQNKVAEGLYSDGTGSGGKTLTGMQAIVADTNTNTVGGISGSTWTFWRNQVLDCSDSGAAFTAATAQPYMNSMYLSTSRGTDKVDLIMADNVYYKAYLESLQAIQRTEKSDMAEAGFIAVKFMGADVVFDGGQGGFCPASHMYFLNTDYLKFRPVQGREFVPLNPETRAPVNQDAVVKILAFAGNLTCSNRALQGVIKA